jgi:hypothetical protein
MSLAIAELASPECGILSGENRYKSLVDGHYEDREHKVFITGKYALGLVGNYGVSRRLRAAITTYPSFTALLDDLVQFLRPCRNAPPDTIAALAMGFDEQAGKVRLVTLNGESPNIEERFLPVDMTFCGSGAGAWAASDYITLARSRGESGPEMHVRCYQAVAEREESCSPNSLVALVTRDGVVIHNDDKFTGYLKAGASAIDLASGIHLNKVLDNLADGTYAKPLSTRVSSGKPLIDFSEGIHLNKILDNVDDGSTFKRLANVNTDNSLHVSTPLNHQGSLVGFSKNTFSYSATATSITWSWGAFSIYLPDGTVISVSAGSASAFTGLSASHSYHFGLYVTLSGPTVHVTMSTQSSGTAKETVQNITQIFQADGNVAVNVDAIANTPASGSGGGGGGTDSCFSPNTNIRTKRGDVAIVDILSGDLVLTARGTWCEVETVTSRNYDGEALDMGNAETVTPRHEFLTENGWKHVGELGRYPWIWYTGTIHNLHLKTQDDPAALLTEHSYTLANGIVAHNFNPT